MKTGIKRFNWSWLRLPLSIVLAWVVLVPAAFALLYIFVFAENAEFHPRRTQTEPVPFIGSTGDGLPTVRLTLHKLDADENTVQASVMAYDGGSFGQLVSEGKSALVAEVSDGSSLLPYGVKNDVVLDASAVKRRAGTTASAVAAESPPFALPAYVSVWGYPFDTLSVRPGLDVTRDGHPTTQFRFEVQKAFPGRTMHVEKDYGFPLLVFSRSASEQIVVMTSAVIFFVLSIALAVRLWRAELSALADLLAVGGYIVAAVSFRDLLGVSREHGTSALEIGAILVPTAVMFAVTLAVVVRPWVKRQWAAASASTTRADAPAATSSR